MLTGEPGIGKTRLLEYAAAAAADLTVIWLTGVESETQLGFGALHRLLRPFLDRVPGLPAPQRDALSAAFGLTGSEPPDRYLVGLATLTVLSASPPISRCCAWSTTCTGWTGSRPRRWRSPRGGCTPTRSPSSSRPAGRSGDAGRLRCPGDACASADWQPLDARALLASASTDTSMPRWLTGSSPGPAAIRWP